MSARICLSCGATVRADCKDDLCKRCRIAEEKKFHTTLRGLGRPVRPGGLAVCKMPHCKKKFYLAHDQDPKYTWYCPTCRKEIAEITTGVLWLESWGIFLTPTDHILEDSLAKAFDIEEVKHETTVRQKTGRKGRPPHAHGTPGVGDAGVPAG